MVLQLTWVKLLEATVVFLGNTPKWQHILILSYKVGTMLLAENEYVINIQYECHRGFVFFGHYCIPSVKKGI